MIRNIALIFAAVASIAIPSEVLAGHLSGRNGNLPANSRISHRWHPYAMVQTTK